MGKSGTFLHRLCFLVQSCIYVFTPDDVYIHLCTHICVIFNLCLYQHRTDIYVIHGLLKNANGNFSFQSYKVKTILRILFLLLFFTIVSQFPQCIYYYYLSCTKRSNSTYKWPKIVTLYEIQKVNYSESS